MAYGTLMITDLLASQNTIVEIGEDRVFESIDMALKVHNQFLAEGLSDLVTPTTDQIKRFGGPNAMTMDDVDELGRADAESVTAGQNVGFPLKLTQKSVQWTRRYFLTATGQELTEQFVAIMDADRVRVMRDLKRAIFYPSNTTVNDRLVLNGLSLPVKVLTNADSGSIPLAPDGTAFTSSTHTHYLATAGASLAAADVDGLINTVSEHYSSGTVMLYINKAQETAIRGFTAAGQFIPYTPVRVMAPTTSYRIESDNLEIQQSYNREIGIYGNQEARVWVKPWIPSGYLFCFMKGPRKPLCMRSRPNYTNDLVLAHEDETYPLRARTMEREYGFGAWERTNGAVLFITAGATYVAPTLT